MTSDRRRRWWYTMRRSFGVPDDDIDETALALHRGLTMPRAERIERWSAMMGILRLRTIDTWRGDFLDALAATPLVEAVPLLPLSA